jgi:putative transcriptional regulator
MILRHARQVNLGNPPGRERRFHHLDCRSVSIASLKSQLLIAAPTLLDPNFRRAVVLLLEHTDEGAVGVVLNRPSETSVSRAVPDLSLVVADEEPVFIGGPVSPGSVIALAEYRDPLIVEAPICGSIAPVEFGTEPDELAEQVTRARAFAGYAGWGAGQLESEIEEEAWFTQPALPGDVFSTEPKRLWAHALERMGAQYRLLARMPDDPRMN